MRGPADTDEADATIAATTRFWRGWLGRARIPDHAFRDAIQRSALTIKGLTYMPTGATVAAPTTSLPETPGGERNWDYRYTWMRDTTFTLQALHLLNLDWEADEFMQFVADVQPNDDGALQIMYGIDGRRELPESTRDDLTGYAGARPVRIGNAAYNQRQNDVFGAVLDSILLHTHRAGRLPRRLWPIVQSQAECATRVWREPDQGIWEARGKPQHYVSSKLMCWVALDRASKLAELRGEPNLTATWKATADEIRADVLAHGVSKSGVLRQHYETDALDASTLLAAQLQVPAPEDERLHATVLAVAEELTQDGFVLRYRTGETDDGLSGEEGTFLICSFWLVSALAIVGEMQMARDLMERLLRIASPLGLYAEEFDAPTGRHLGNFPQAFSHLALIDAAGRIIAPQLLRGVLTWTATTSSSSEAAPEAAPSPATSLRRASACCCSSAAAGCPREPGNWLVAGRVRRQQVRLARDVVRRARKAVPAPGALLRRGRDQALRRGALPPAQGGLRRAAPPRWHLARVADRLRGDGAVLHAGGAALRGARRARRGSDGATGERAVPATLPSRTSRASSSSPTIWPPPVTIRSTRHAGSCSTRPTRPTARACAA